MNEITKESLEKLTSNIHVIDRPSMRILLAEAYLDIWNLVKSAYKDGDKYGHGEHHVYCVLKRAIEITTAMHGYREIILPVENRFMTDYFARYLMVGLAALTHDMYSHVDRKRHHLHARAFVENLTSLGFRLSSLDKDYSIESLLSNPELAHVVLTIPNFNYKDMASYSFKWLMYFNNQDEIHMAAKAVKEHRASNKNGFSNVLSEIVSAADRDDLDLSIIINRIYNSATDGHSLFNCDIDGFKEHVIVIDNFDYVSSVVINHLRKVLNWDDAKIKTFYHLWEKFSRNGYAFKNLKEDGIYMLYYKDKIEEFFKEVDRIISNPRLMLGYIKRAD